MALREWPTTVIAVTRSVLDVSINKPFKDITPFEYVVRSYRYTSVYYGRFGFIIGMREGTCFQRM